MSTLNGNTRPLWLWWGLWCAVCGFCWGAWYGGCVREGVDAPRHPEPPERFEAIAPRIVRDNVSGVCYAYLNDDALVVPCGPEKR